MAPEALPSRRRDDRGGPGCQRAGGRARRIASRPVVSLFEWGGRDRRPTKGRRGSPGARKGERLPCGRCGQVPSRHHLLASTELPSGPVRRRSPDASPRSGGEREQLTTCGPSGEASPFAASRGPLPRRRGTRIAARGISSSGSCDLSSHGPAIHGHQPCPLRYKSRNGTSGASTRLGRRPLWMRGSRTALGGRPGDRRGRGRPFGEAATAGLATVAPRVVGVPRPRSAAGRAGDERRR